MISATVVAHSKSEVSNTECISYILRYPRSIHSEFMTHRMFSRNAASSRAVPFNKMIKMIKDDPFIPIAFQENHPGMQGTTYIEDEQIIQYVTKQILFLRDVAVDVAERIGSNNVTKQIINRYLEPFMWYTCLVTATEYENFFKLRCPQYENPNNPDEHFRSRKDAIKKYPFLEGTVTEMEWMKWNKGAGEIHIMALAEAMWDAKNESTPKILKPGEWHIPFGDKIDIERLPLEKKIEHKTMKEKITDTMLKVATARCARVSYINYEGTDDYVKDVALFENLLKQGHMSPFEHCSQAMGVAEYTSFTKGKAKYITGDYLSDVSKYFDDEAHGWCNNLKGFIQLRYLVENNFNQ